MNSPNISILAPSDNHVISEGDHGVHTVRRQDAREIGQSGQRTGK